MNVGMLLLLLLFDFAENMNRSKHGDNRIRTVLIVPETDWECWRVIENILVLALFGRNAHTPHRTAHRNRIGEIEIYTMKRVVTNTEIHRLVNRKPHFEFDGCNMKRWESRKKNRIYEGSSDAVRLWHFFYPTFAHAQSTQSTHIHFNVDQNVSPLLFVVVFVALLSAKNRTGEFVRTRNTGDSCLSKHQTRMIRQQQKQKTIRVNNKKTSEKKTGTQLFRNAIKRIKICCRKWLWNRLLVRMVFKFRFEKDFKALMIMNIKNSFFFLLLRRD